MTPGREQVTAAGTTDPEVAVTTGIAVAPASP